jgi:hypothetical protein
VSPVIVKRVELRQRESHPNCGSDHSQYLRGAQKKPKSKPWSWICFFCSFRTVQKSFAKPKQAWSCYLEPSCMSSGIPAKHLRNGKWYWEKRHWVQSKLLALAS